MARRKAAKREEKVKPRRAGLPSVDSIARVVSPKGKSFTILRTTERDAYDEPRTGKKRREP